MSEFRDLTVALRTLADRLTGVEDCMVILVRNSEQEKDWRHEQRNRAMLEDGRTEEREKALQQIQEFMGAFGDRLQELIQRFDNFVLMRHADIKGLNQRVRDLENEQGNDEVTKT
jgi:hypothetical protein